MNGFWTSVAGTAFMNDVDTHPGWNDAMFYIAISILVMIWIFKKVSPYLKGKKKDNVEKSGEKGEEKGFPFIRVLFFVVPSIFCIAMVCYAMFHPYPPKPHFPDPSSQQKSIPIKHEKQAKHTPLIRIDNQLLLIMNPELKNELMRNVAEMLSKNGITLHGKDINICGTDRVNVEYPDSDVQYGSKEGYAHVCVYVRNMTTGKQLWVFKGEGKTGAYFLHSSITNDELKTKALREAIINIKYEES